MLLSGVLITHQLSDEALGWFAKARKVVDELVVFVDEDRAPRDLDAKLRRLDARIVNTRAPEFYKADFRTMLSACRGEWLLKIDYDEELSREWQDPRWREVLHQTEFTHFWCPRRWITASGNYIASEPWWPDWQLRLFRNDPAKITFPTQLHETMRMNGPAGYLRTLAIHHHDLRLATRVAREAKAKAYERKRPGNGLGFFYLYEDHGVPESPLPPENEFDPAREILRMEPVGDEEAGLLSLAADAPPSSVAAKQLLWLNVRLTNGTSRTIRTGAPFPLNLAYHWLDAASGDPVVFDGERTALVPELVAGETASFRMFITAPDKTGAYLLRLTIVQERTRWLDSPNSPTVQDFAVTVTCA